LIVFALSVSSWRFFLVPIGEADGREPPEAAIPGAFPNLTFALRPESTEGVWKRAYVIVNDGGCFDHGSDEAAGMRA
jgi:hypothetical protein